MNNPVEQRFYPTGISEIDNHFEQDGLRGGSVTTYFAYPEAPLEHIVATSVRKETKWITLFNAESRIEELCEMHGDTDMGVDVTANFEYESIQDNFRSNKSFDRLLIGPLNVIYEKFSQAEAGEKLQKLRQHGLEIADIVVFYGYKLDATNDWAVYSVSDNVFLWRQEKMDTDLQYFVELKLVDPTISPRTAAEEHARVFEVDIGENISASSTRRYQV